MVALGREGGLAGEDVNLGGIHFQKGREEALPYIFLDEEVRGHLETLRAEGAEVTARDLPDSAAVPLKDLLE